MRCNDACKSGQNGHHYLNKLSQNMSCVVEITQSEVKTVFIQGIDSSYHMSIASPKGF